MNHHTFSHDVGKRIRQARGKLGLSQHQLALDAGMSLRMVSYWERGIGVPKADSLCAICEVLGVSADFILCRTKNMEVSG